MLNIQSLVTRDVQTAYSGKAGKCACGCAGKHWVNPIHLAAATIDRGYQYDDEQIDAGQVTKILRLLQAAHAEYPGAVVIDQFAGETIVSVDVGKRAYVLYLAHPAVPMFAAAAE